MNGRKVISQALMLFIASLLTACGGAVAAPTATVPHAPADTAAPTAVPAGPIDTPTPSSVSATPTVAPTHMPTATPTPSPVPSGPAAGAIFSGPIDGGTITFKIGPDGATIDGWSVTIDGAVACAEGGTVSGIQATFEFVTPIENQAFDYDVIDPFEFHGLFETATTARGSYKMKVGAGSGVCTIGPLEWSATATEPRQVAGPEMGHWEGEPSVLFDVTADGTVSNFGMLAPFPPTTCNVTLQETPIEQDGTFTFSASLEGGAFENRIQGKFDSPTTVAGTFLVQHCGNSVISGAKEGTWRAEWKGPASPPETAAPARPTSGEWTASAPKLGDFGFTVAPDGAAVTMTGFLFADFKCGPVTVSGFSAPVEAATGTITEGRVKVTTAVGPFTITIDGAFDEAGKGASGAWEAQHLDGTICSGTWEAEFGEMPVARVTPVMPTAASTAIPTEVPAKPTEIQPTPEWSVVISETFDSNENDWPLRTLTNEYVTNNWSITEGKYRWRATAHQAFHWYVHPDIESTSDLRMTVEAQQVSGPINAAYGLVFRFSSSGFYYFAISDVQQYAFIGFLRDEWQELIPWSPSPAIRPGEVNKITVLVEGLHFVFYVNDQFVAEADEDTLRRGMAGVSIELPNAGDEGVFEFDNFELLTP